MRKLFLYFLFSWIFTAALVFAVFFFYGAPKIKQSIEKYGSSFLGTPVTVEGVDLSYWPLSIVIRNISFDKKGTGELKVQLPVTSMTLNIKQILNKKLGANIEIKRPVIYVERPPPPPTAPGALPDTAPQARVSVSVQSSMQLSLSLHISDGVLQAKNGDNELSATGMNLDFGFENINGPYSLNLEQNSELSWSGNKVSLPTRLKSQFTYSGQNFETKSTTVELGGIGIELAGSSDLLTSTDNWDANIDVSDVGKLENLSKYFPVSEVSGSLKSQIHAKSQEGKWIASGTFESKGLAGELNYSKEDRVFKGKFKLESLVDFVYREGLVFKKLFVNADLSNATLAMGTEFSKPQGVLLKVLIDSSEANGTLIIKKGELNFSTLSAKVSGIVNSAKGASSDLTIDIPRTNLTGLEKFFPFIASNPLRGFIQIKASVHGDLNNPTALNLNVNPLDLSHVQSTFKWRSKDSQNALQGQLILDTHAVLQVQGKNLISAAVNTQADLTGLDIDFKKQFQKRTGFPLKVSFLANKKGSAIDVAKSSLITQAGTIMIKGSFQDPQSPVMDLGFKFPEIDLAGLARLFPMLAEYRIAGKIGGVVGLKGRYDFKKGLENSPLHLAGQVSANIPEFIYKSQNAPSKKSVPAVSGPNIPNEKSSKGPLAPTWKIIKDMNLVTLVKIGRVVANDLVITGVDGKAKIFDGNLTGSLKIAQIFGGELNADKFGVSLVVPQPSTTIHASLSKVNLVKALEWCAPQWKDLAKGIISGVLTMSIASADRSDFIAATQIKGDVRIVDGFLSSLQFDKYVNDKLSQIPGLGRKMILNSGGANANIDSSFDFFSSRLNFKTLHVLTPEKNEMNVQGFVNIDRQMDLKGNVYLSNASVPPSIKEANSDSAGRLIVPVHFTGLVTNPELNLSQETIQKMLANSARNEAAKLKNQLIEKAQTELPKQLENEAKKKLQDLFGH